MILPWQQAFLDEQRLTPAYLETAQRFFEPLAARFARLRSTRDHPLLVGINGSQGSGKTTLCAYLCRTLLETHGLRAIDLSIDDFYLTAAERNALADSVHPLLQARGVPGTHDLDLLRQTLSALGEPSGEPVRVPRFDKAEDDRFPVSRWSTVERPIDVILLEGWCMGARAAPATELATPINALERDEDGDGMWRAYVNERLRSDFEPLYESIDDWVMLAAPDFEQILAWRTEQEEKLRARVGEGGAGLMNDEQLRRFVYHFERVTRQCLENLPPKTNVVLRLDRQRNIIAARGLET